MPERGKNLFGDESENRDIKPTIESNHDAEFNAPFESGLENLEDEAEQIEKLREELGIAGKDQQEVGLNSSIDATANAEKIKQYQERYLPKYLKKKKGIVAKRLVDLWALGIKFEKEGEENIPENGPFVVVCNHFGGGDVPVLFKAFLEKELHFVAGKSMLWDDSFFVRWFLKQIKAIPVQESLANLTTEEKEDAWEKQTKRHKPVFRRIIEQEKQGKAAIDTEFIHQAVAVLSRGDALCVFPEGLWLNPQGLNREKAELKKAYGGLEIIASQFEKLTGTELPILPTVFNEDRQTGISRVVIGESIVLSENDSGLSGTDWCMARVAKMLPEEKRGYYAGLVKKFV